MQRTRFGAGAALVAIAGLAAPALGQTVFTPIRASPDHNYEYRNATIAVSPNGEVVVASVQKDPAQPFHWTRYAISLDNGATFPYTDLMHGSELPSSPSVVYADGQFWLTAAATVNLTNTGVLLTRKDASATSFPSPDWIVTHATGTEPNVSESFVTAGADPLSPSGTRLYALYNHGTPGETSGCSGSDMRLMASARWDGPDVTDWTEDLRLSPPGNPCEYVGYSPVAAVTDGGDLLALSGDRSFGVESWRNGGRPWVIQSDDAGANWSPTAVLIGENASPSIGGPEADDAVEIDGGNHYPGLAVKRRFNANDHAYAIFLGRSPDTGSTNLDIYISRSTNGGVTFPVDSQNLVHLSDSDLHGVTPTLTGPDQIMASVVAGACDNDVHFFWYDTVDDDPSTTGDVEARLYYGRIRHFGTAQQTLTVLPLDQAFSTDLGSGQVRYLGRRQQIVVRKVLKDLWVYCAYTALDDEGRQGVYVQRILWENDLCAGDLSGNGLVDPEDATLFQAAYDLQDPAADLNQDEQVDAQDQLIFQDAYQSGCGQ